MLLSLFPWRASLHELSWSQLFRAMFGVSSLSLLILCLFSTFLIGCPYIIPSQRWGPAQA